MDISIVQLCIPGSLDIQFQLIDLLLETAARGYFTERNSLATAANQKKKSSPNNK